VLYADSFSDLEGTVKLRVNLDQSVQGPPVRRLVYFFSPKELTGLLTMQIVEDNVTAGPDGQPGVLALSWQVLPPTLPYSGFTYLGEPAGRIPLPRLQQVRSVDDLRGMYVKFYFKAANAMSDQPLMLNVGCRLEPNLPDSFSKRIDLGEFVATSEWGVHEVELAGGANLEAFLQAVAAESPTSFKLVWAQAGALNNFHPGDTLYLDDIEIRETPK
jgi:hypothetical protein